MRSCPPHVAAPHLNTDALRDDVNVFIFLTTNPISDLTSPISDLTSPISDGHFFHHLPMHLHSVNAGVFWMSPVALHQNLDVAKGSGMIILQRKWGGTKEWGFKFPFLLLRRAPVAGMWEHREGQGAGVLPGVLPLSYLKQEGL